MKTKNVQHEQQQQQQAPRQRRPAPGSWEVLSSAGLGNLAATAKYMIKYAAATTAAKNIIYIDSTEYII